MQRKHVLVINDVVADADNDNDDGQRRPSAV